MTDSNIIQLHGTTETGEEHTHQLKVNGAGAFVDALKALDDGRDRVMMNAINSKIGKDWSLTDIINRVELVTGPNKHETLMFDGVGLVEFWPHKTVMQAHTLTITQKYRKLYSTEGEH